MQSTNINELLEKVKQDRHAIAEITSTYKDKLKDRLASPLAFIAVFSAGLILSKIITHKKTAKTTTVANNKGLPLTASVLSMSLPKILWNLYHATTK